MKDGEKSLNKIFQILELLSEFPEGTSSKELITGLGMPRSTVFRMLKFLEDRGYLKKIGSDYVLGNNVLKLGAAATKQNSILKIAHPYLSELARLTRETVHLAELRGNKVCYIDKVEGSRSIRMASMIGNLAPVYCTGIGKAILAFLPEHELKDCIDDIEFEKFTSTTIISRKRLLDELEKIRKNKAAYDNCEHEEGVFCIAAPIFDVKGDVIAAISVAGAELYLREKAEEYLEMTKDTANSISRALGARI